MAAQLFASHGATPRDEFEQLWEIKQTLLFLAAKPTKANATRGAEEVSCPSSDDLSLVRRFVKGGSGSSGLEFKPATDAASVG